MTAALLGGCHDYTITKSQVLNANSLLHLPPIGFNHVYGPSPLDSRDAMTVQRQLFAERAYWEVYVGTDPLQAGFVALSDPAAVQQARRSTTSMILTIATENVDTIDGLLSYPGQPGPARYAEDLLEAVEGLGYDRLTSAQVHIYFSERYEYANLSWSRTAGYSYTVLISWQSPATPAPPLARPVLTRAPAVP